MLFAVAVISAQRNLSAVADEGCPVAGAPSPIAAKPICFVKGRGLSGPRTPQIVPEIRSRAIVLPGDHRVWAARLCVGRHRTAMVKRTIGASAPSASRDRVLSGFDVSVAEMQIEVRARAKRCFSGSAGDASSSGRPTGRLRPSRAHRFARRAAADRSCAPERRCC